jgi:hypothetical protein
MESTPTGRPKPGERLSVVWLALRLRLNGSHTSPRAQVGYRAVHAIALLVLLYQAVAARILVLLGAASAIGLAVAIRVVFVDQAFPPIAVTDVTRWAWLALSVLVVFITPSDARASRGLWVGAYPVGSAIAVPAFIWPYVATPAPMISPWWVHLSDIGELASVGLLVAMIIVLATTQSAAWLLGLAIMAGGLNGVRLLSSLLRRWPFGRPPQVVQANVLSVLVLVVAVVCVAIGLLRWRRVPSR